MTEADQEIWENNTLGLVAVLKQDRRGDLTHEIVQAGQRITLSANDRLLNQDKAAGEDLDVFMNGTLTPIRILDGSEKADEITRNPNIIAESDMADLFKLNAKNFAAKVAEISRPLTLNRMLAIADEVDATVRQVAVLKDRLNEVAPPTYVEVSTHGPRAERAPKAVSPK